MIKSEMNYIGCQKSGAYMQRGLSKVSGNPLGTVDTINLHSKWVHQLTVKHTGIIAITCVIS